PRIRMLETIREYALERLDAAGEAVDLGRRHAAWCLTLAERALPELRGPEQAGWLARLDRELDNIRSALAWALEHDAAAGLRLAGALWRFWLIRGHRHEGRTWLEGLLALPPSAGAGTDTAGRARALHAAGSLAYNQDDYER